MYGQLPNVLLHSPPPTLPVEFKRTRPVTTAHTCSPIAITAKAKSERTGRDSWSFPSGGGERTPTQLQLPMSEPTCSGIRRRTDRPRSCSACSSRRRRFWHSSSAKSIRTRGKDDARAHLRIRPRRAAYPPLPLVFVASPKTAHRTCEGCISFGRKEKKRERRGFGWVMAVRLFGRRSLYVVGK